MSQADKKETRQFQAEVRQLLDLMVHSIYGNKEIFLRELISNASDALDKMRFEALANEALYEGNADLAITVSFDKEARTVIVSDNGIGMSHDEIIENLGTIAHSGTKEFVKSLTGDQSKDANLIGQFGVGFYSSFIVADRVTVLSRRAGHSTGVRWESRGDGEYTVEAEEGLARGTSIILHLRGEEDEFLDGWRLRSVIRKFSDHVSWPIRMVSDNKEKEGEVETVNKASALWTRSRSEVTEEEYKEFYKHISHDYQDPLAYHHARLEGKYEYTVLLYLPERAPFDLWDRERKHGVKLFVRRVFIMEGAEDLLPRYLRFVKGVVDSADLPLNISREILQQNRAVEAIRKGVVGRVLTMLEEMVEKEPEKYVTFWKNFGKVMKEGVVEDHGHQERVAKLLRFASTHTGSPDQVVSLQDYVSRMQEGQEKIYYVLGDTHSAAINSPHLEIFRKKGIEVLVFSDRVDEWLVTHLEQFDGKSLQAVSKGELDLGKLQDAAEEEELKKSEGDMESLRTKMAEILAGKVKEVRLTNRLTDSPCCLVGEEHDMSHTLERFLRSAGQEVPESKRILELNPHHPIVVRLQAESEQGRIEEWSHLLYEQALLGEGGTLNDPMAFVKRLNRMLLVMSGQ
ncbi:MAG: molecular chaperone HtpG [Magnetococcales bacterium]|nr:molecular chaperone HtpG [Magnetococcales bacterium]NGZ29042.1 molecular chaperone HtpG [Magnetococcales bacterium]